MRIGGMAVTHKEAKTWAWFYLHKKIWAPLPIKKGIQVKMTDKKLLNKVVVWLKSDEQGPTYKSALDRNSDTMK